MTDTGLDIQLLWSALQGLEVGLLPEETTVPTVRIQVEGGAVLEVFRAQVVEAAMVAWRVRGFTDDGSVRLAVILGTQDGRAMVTERVIPEQASTVVAGLVTGMVLPLSAPTQSPPIRLVSFRRSEKSLMSVLKF